MSSSLIGRTLGKYQVTEHLGQGGMGTVYKGYQADIDRYVAIKVLPPHPGLDAQFIQRFQLEARTIARLQHPHILPLYDFGSEDNILYLVVAYIDGGTLADLIDHGPIKPGVVDKTLREIAGALDYAHRQGVIHRDIKPGNILLDSEGHALLADFGIVKLTEGGANLTGTGVVGTPAYMAPEQGQGLGVDARSDIYSLGVVVYEMLAGRQPYGGDTPMQVIIRHMQDPVPRISQERANLPPAVDQVMQKVLAKDPEDRYQTAVEFAEAFTRAVHRSDDSVADARSQTPLEARPLTQNAAPASSTMQLDDTHAPVSRATEQFTQPTIVVQGSGTNPLVLLGGFAIIAVVIVVVVVLLVSNQGGMPVTEPTAAPTSAQVVDQPTTVPTAAPTVVSVPTFGSLRFSKSSQSGDTAQMQFNELKPLPDGQVYAVWLVNTLNNSTLSLGQPTLDAFGTGSLTFPDAGGNVLAAWYNAVIVTSESEIGDAPAGEVKYSGSVPSELMLALREILVVARPADDAGDFDGQTVETMGSGSSLLAGALAEASTARQHSGLAAGATNVGGMHTHAEHTINILMGTTVDYNGNGRGENPGKGIGVPFYLDKIEGLLGSATANASTAVQSEAELIRVCTVNVRGWVDQIVSLETELLAAQDIDSVAKQKTDATNIADMVMNGFDLNENGQVEPFEGECGLQQIETFGALSASMELVEGTLEES